MAFSNGTIGLGVTVGYSAIPATTYTSLGEIIDASLPDINMGKVEFTHAASTQVEYKPGLLPEYGDVTINVAFLKAEYNTLEGFASAGTLKTWKITVPNTGGQGGDAIFEGFISKLGAAVPIKDRVSASITFTITNWTGFTPAA
jgi:hypothetical protein